MKVYLESCPYAEKDEAKKAGARWDANAKKWYVPEALLHQIEHFNQWKPNGKVYLNCPFSDKDRVKKLGARWDGSCKKWYFVPTKNRTEEIFREWLPSYHHGHSDGGPPSSPSAAASPSPPPSPPPPVVTATSSSATKKKRKGGYDENDAPKKAAKPAVKKAKKKSGGLSDDIICSEDISSDMFASLPRIAPSMTLAQLNHELHHRDPSVKGTSNKNKQWFLSRLGVGSIWMSSTDASDIDFSSVPRVSSFMTIAQLSHEMLERKPECRGLSGKNKSWFLEQLGQGSVWITGLGTAGVEDD